MAWFKVDDRLTVSSKVMRIPRSKRIEAMGLWVMCGAWSAHDLTDGFIPAFVVEELGGTEDVVQALLDARLWEPDSHDGDDGYQFVNWADYQPTKESIEERRARDAERKRAQRRTESGQFASDSNNVQSVSERSPSGHDADTENVQAESAVPVPSRPVPDKDTLIELADEGPQPTPIDEYDFPGFREFWNAYPRKVDKKPALKAYKAAVKRASRTDIHTGAVAYAKASTQTPADKIKHASTWLNGDCWNNDYTQPDERTTDPIAYAHRNNIPEAWL